MHQKVALSFESRASYVLPFSWRVPNVDREFLQETQCMNALLHNIGVNFIAVAFRRTTVHQYPKINKNDRLAIKNRTGLKFAFTAPHSRTLTALY